MYVCVCSVSKSLLCVGKKKTTRETHKRENEPVIKQCYGVLYMPFIAKTLHCVHPHAKKGTSIVFNVWSGIQC